MPQLTREAPRRVCIQQFGWARRISTDNRRACRLRSLQRRRLYTRAHSPDAGQCGPLRHGPAALDHRIRAPAHIHPHKRQPGFSVEGNCDVPIAEAAQYVDRYSRPSVVSTHGSVVGAVRVCCCHIVRGLCAHPVLPQQFSFLHLPASIANARYLGIRDPIPPN